jgi:hypothetical protein
MKPDITIITPGGDRPWSFNLLKHYLLRQTFPGTMQWLVISDSQNQKPYEMIWTQFALQSDPRFIQGELHQLTYDKTIIGPKSLARNLVWGLMRAKGEIIFICEDDDWYGSDHVKECINHLAQPEIKVTGTIWQRYYHLPSLTYRTYKNVGSALCSTAFHRDLIQPLINSAVWCEEHEQRGIDRRFWDSLPEDQKDIFEPLNNQVIGMKGLPGRIGIGVGHRPRGFEADPEAKMLREWIGNDADTYLQLRSQHNVST